MKYLSIIIPVYNCENYISDCLDSILNQGIPEEEYEIIVVNDGSTDNSLKILEDYKRKYNQIKVFSQSNQGVSATRNHGFAEAIGNYIWFVDGDDIIMPNSLPRIWNFLKNDDYDLIHFKLKRLRIEEVPQFIEEQTNSVCNVKEKIITGKDILSISAAGIGVYLYVVKRSHIKSLGLKFKEGVIQEDGPFSIELYLQSDKILDLNCILYLYMVRGSSLVTGRSLDNIRRLISGYKYAANALNNIVLKYNEKVSPIIIHQIIKERDSFLFSEFICLAKYANVREVKNTIKLLEKARLYPVKDLEEKGYSSLKLKLFSFLFNHKRLFTLYVSIRNLFKPSLVPEEIKESL